MSDLVTQNTQVNSCTENQVRGAPPGSLNYGDYRPVLPSGAGPFEHAISTQQPRPHSSRNMSRKDGELSQERSRARSGPGSGGRTAGRGRRRPTDDSRPRTSGPSSGRSGDQISNDSQPFAQPGSSPSAARGLNANHLLNFRHQPRSKPERCTPGKKTRPQPYRREVFLQANYRFAITSSADLSPLSSDPDRMIDWDEVVQVDIMSAGSESIRCPITLEPFVCPHMTACGHVFSFSAIIHHAMIHGGPELRAAAPCPLCFTPFVARELRCVRMVEISPVSTGIRASFRLLSRPKDSILPQGCGPSASDRSSMSMERFAKFRLVDSATEEFLVVANELAAYAAQVTADQSFEASSEVELCSHGISLLASRAAALESRRAGPPDGEGPARSEAAYNVVHAAQQSLVALCQAAREEAVLTAQIESAAKEHNKHFPSLPVPSSCSTVATAPQQAPEQVPYPVEPGFCSMSAGSSVQPYRPAVHETAGGNASVEGSLGPPLQHEPEAAAASDLLLGTHPSGNTCVGLGKGDEGWYFYFQAEDGQWAFLHPLNVRAILSYYGSYAFCPAVLDAPVVEVEKLVQSEETRRRLKFLGHIPLTAEFQLVEVDLSGILPGEALAPFAGELAARHKRRERKAKALAREAAKDARREAAEAHSHKGPTMEEWRLQPLPAQATIDFSENLTGVLELDGGEEVVSSEGGEGSSAGGSFAAITRMGFAAAMDSPSLTSNAQPVTRGPQGVWGGGASTSLLPSTSPPARSPLPTWGGCSSRPGGAVGGSGAPGGGVWSAGGPPSSSSGDANASTGARKRGSGKKAVLLFSSGGQRRY